MKNISIIACISSDRGLGQGNDLLWRIPADQRFFRQTTLGSPVVMGGKTFRSIGRPLPGRQNLVLSRQSLHQMTNQPSNQASIQAPSRPAAATKCAVGSTTLQVFANMSELEKYLATLDGEIFIIGGATLYQHFLPQAQTLYLTEVDAVRPAEVYFPEFNPADFTTKNLQTGKIPLVEAIAYSEDIAANNATIASAPTTQHSANDNYVDNNRDAIINYRMVKYERH